MNPLTNMKNVIKLSEQELYTSNKTSWHDQYRDSAWLFIGGLPYDLTEGDIVCIFSQYGEVVNMNLIRDKDTGKSKGFCFLCYEDQRSTILAVDNLNGIKILNRAIRVDHVTSYKMPKQHKKTDAETKKLYEEGCAPKPVAVQIPAVKGPVKIKKDPDDFRETLVDQIDSEIKLPPRLPIHQIKLEKIDADDNVSVKEKEKKHKKDKKKKKKKKKSRKSSGSEVEDSEREKSKKRKKKRKKSSSGGSQEESEQSESDEERKRKKSHR